MTEDDAFHNRQESTWHLLIESVLADRPASGHRSMRQITGAMRALSLQPAEVERIEKTVVETLGMASQQEGRDQHNSGVCIRIWISGSSAGSLQLPAPGALEAGQPKDRGWGFFVVQRQEDDLRASSGESRHLVDLFLYQEG